MAEFTKTLLDTKTMRDAQLSILVNSPSYLVDVLTGASKELEVKAVMTPSPNSKPGKSSWTNRMRMRDISSQ
jgi:hypothetical protein